MMRLLQVTNIISHHQLPIARCLASRLGENNFRFVATHPAIKEREKLGWDCKQNEPWILRAGENQADQEQFEFWWSEADVVICGDRLFKLIKNRLYNNKLTFYMSERWWKPPIGIARLLYPPFALMAMRFRKLAKSTYVHFLAIGDYSAQDMNFIASFNNRMWRWGYFTALANPLSGCERKDGGLHVLWAGRMLKWKRVDTLIRAFCKLIAQRPDSFLTLVGDGAERKKLEKLARKLLTPNSFRFLSPRSVPQVLQLMREHHIYVLTSNAYEGWGAVINEAMAEGCAVIASEATGAGKTLIRDEENGLLIQCGDWKRLSELLCALSNDASRRMRIAKEGQRTIKESWSPIVAADRFLSVCDTIINNKTIPLFKSGPMSLI